ncbi:MAG: hypothetical protein Q7S66_05810 [bacterium]|nr:hypothetical protein [bacterium]
MNKLEKVIFWGGLGVVITDNIYWQWWFKLTVDPPFGGDIFRWQSMAGDIVILIVWVYVLVRVYKRANRVKQEGAQ